LFGCAVDAQIECPECGGVLIFEFVVVVVGDEELFVDILADLAREGEEW